MGDYCWFPETRHKWTYGEAEGVALKYKTVKEFRKDDGTLYNICLRRGWLDTFDWLGRDINPHEGKRDSVYAYFFPERNAVYVGRSVDVSARDKQHRDPAGKSPVWKFAGKNGLEIPKPVVLENSLSLREGLAKEDLYVRKYKSEGWRVLNRAKTGERSGRGRGGRRNRRRASRNRRHAVRQKRTRKGTRFRTKRTRSRHFPSFTC